MPISSLPIPLATSLLLLAAGSVSPAATNDPPDSNKSVTDRIRDEGMNHSQVMDTLWHLTEGIGPRLTGSPNLKRANEWTRDKLAAWGLKNAHLEPWGPFGRGWSLKSFSAEVVQPQVFPLVGYPSAWSPGFDKPIVADAVYFDAKTNGDLQKFKGKLRGAIVLAGPIRELKTSFEPFARRFYETNLLALANAGAGTTAGVSGGLTRERSFDSPPRGRSSYRGFSSTNTASETLTNSSSPLARRRFGGQNRFTSFLAGEGPAALLSAGFQGDSGAFFVAAASIPGAETNRFGSSSNSPRVWSTNAPAIPPQVTIAAEDYNRVARLLQNGEHVKIALDLQVKFNDDDLMAYNTIAEIPGSDLKDELVMVGAHLDSWHSGTGATDNGAGAAAAMEAVRIIKALHLQPRRTIRIALWTGEEQGLLGSKAYVAKHFGYYTNTTPSSAVSAPKESASRRPGSGSSGTNSPSTRKLVKGREYSKISAYFNLDNGAGKIRGVYLQGNEAVRSLFRQWLAPFDDLGAETLSLASTGSTDHVSFDGLGIPGFQFIQDPMDYMSRTHHSNQDVYDRVQPDDLKEASVVLASFIYNTAMLPEKLPRKPSD